MEQMYKELFNFEENYNLQYCNELILLQESLNEVYFCYFYL